MSVPPAFDPAQAIAAESFELWSAGCTAWANYLGRLAVATGPAAWLEANAALVSDSLDLSERAAAARLGGALRAPLLSDA